MSKHYIAGALVLAAIICIGDTAVSIIIAAALVGAATVTEVVA